MRINLLWALAVSAAVLPAEAQEDPAKGCPGPDTSSIFESCVLMKETSALERKLREIIRDRTNPDSAAALRASQKAWKRYRDKACEYEQVEYGGINSINAVRCWWKLTGDRVRYFEELP